MMKNYLIYKIYSMTYFKILTFKGQKRPFIKIREIGEMGALPIIKLGEMGA